MPPGGTNLTFRKTLVACLLISCCPAHAWVSSGHEQIADIAWTLLKPEARREIVAILKEGEPTFRPRSDEESEIRRAFRSAASWADWVKENKGGPFEQLALAWNAKFQPGYDSSDPEREAHRCRRWHYFDVPIRTRGLKPGVQPSNALVALTSARYEFSILGRQPIKDRKDQCWWLYWIEHLVGDVHQPLHCASSYEFETSGDAGGNLFRLTVPNPTDSTKTMNLHFLWDGGIEEAVKSEVGKLSDVESVTARWIEECPLTPEEAEETDFAHWISDSKKLADDFAYTGIARNQKPSEAYRARLVKVCKRQAVLAGVRLANELNLGLGFAGR